MSGILQSRDESRLASLMRRLNTLSIAGVTGVHALTALAVHDRPLALAWVAGCGLALLLLHVWIRTHIVREMFVAAEAHRRELDDAHASLQVTHDWLAAAVTARDKAEIDLRQAQKLEAVGRLAAGVAHEINTPLQFVSDSVHFVRDGMGEMLDVIDSYRNLRAAAANTVPDEAAAAAAVEEAADLPYLAEGLPKALDRSLEGLRRVESIVRGLKAFAHPDQKEKAPSDLNEAVRTTLTVARNAYKYVAEVETELGALPPVTCHLGEVNQVLLNLIVNAADAIADVVEGTEEKGQIRVKTWHEGEDVCVSVSDTGGGIPAEIRSKIFEPFFTTKEVGRGSGQGLAIAHSIVVEKHGGQITFETAPRLGTRFVVRLPVGPRMVDGAQAA